MMGNPPHIFELCTKWVPIPMGMCSYGKGRHRFGSYRELCETVALIHGTLAKAMIRLKARLHYSAPLTYKCPGIKALRMIGTIECRRHQNNVTNRPWPIFLLNNRKVHYPYGSLVKEVWLRFLQLCRSLATNFKTRICFLCLPQTRIGLTFLDSSIFSSTKVTNVCQTSTQRYAIPAMMYLTY